MLLNVPYTHLLTSSSQRSCQVWITCATQLALCGSKSSQLDEVADTNNAAKTCKPVRERKKEKIAVQQSLHLYCPDLGAVNLIPAGTKMYFSSASAGPSASLLLTCTSAASRQALLALPIATPRPTICTPAHTGAQSVQLHDKGIC